MWACVVYKWLCGVGCHHIVLESTRDRCVYEPAEIPVAAKHQQQHYDSKPIPWSGDPAATAAQHPKPGSL